MKFEIVSIQEFKNSLEKLGYISHLDTVNDIKDLYNSIELPKRSTKYSAGYDFKIPIKRLDYFIEICLKYIEKDKQYIEIVIPTGIKCDIEKDKFLAIVPRSSYGIKYGISLLNTMGVIDADYYNNKDNEGHIMIALKIPLDKMKQDKKSILKALQQGERFAQGIFTKYYTVDDDSTSVERVGGIGSTI